MILKIHSKMIPMHCPFHHQDLSKVLSEKRVEKDREIVEGELDKPGTGHVRHDEDGLLVYKHSKVRSCIPFKGKKNPSL